MSRRSAHAAALAEKPARTARYASAQATAALLDSGRHARLMRLDAGDMVNTEDAARLAGASKATIVAWIDAGRCIGLTRATRGYRLPAWQFEPRIFEALPDISRAMETIDGWALLQFLETPHGALGGSTPRQALERGLRQRVVALAGAH